MEKQKRSTRAVNWARRTNLNKKIFLEELKKKRTLELIKDITGRDIQYEELYLEDSIDIRNFDITNFYKLMAEKGFNPIITTGKNEDGIIITKSVSFYIGDVWAIANCHYCTICGENNVFDTFQVGNLIEFTLNTELNVEQTVEAILLISERIPEWQEDQKAIDEIFVKKERIKGLIETAILAQLNRIMKGKNYRAYWKGDCIKVDVTFPNNSYIILQYSAHADFGVYKEIGEIIDGMEALLSATDKLEFIPRNKIRRNHKHFYEEWYTICTLQNNRNFVIKRFTYEGDDKKYTSEAEIEFITSRLNPLITKKHVKIKSYDRIIEF
jgi:hypothetical protein